MTIATATTTNSDSQFYMDGYLKELLMGTTFEQMNFMAPELGGARMTREEFVNQLGRVVKEMSTMREWDLHGLTSN